MYIVYRACNGPIQIQFYLSYLMIIQEAHGDSYHMTMT